MDTELCDFPPSVTMTPSRSDGKGKGGKGMSPTSSLPPLSKAPYSPGGKGIVRSRKPTIDESASRTKLEVKVQKEHSSIARELWTRGFPVESLGHRHAR